MLGVLDSTALRRAIPAVFVFLPLAFLYFAINIVFSSPTPAGDEGGYMEYAVRIAQGWHRTPIGPGLWWGPGYPLLLTPFAAFGLPWMAAKLLNPLFLIGAMAYCYGLLSRYTTKKAALAVTACLGLYPPMMRDEYSLTTESLTVFLICGLVFHFCSLYNSLAPSWVDRIAASAYFAYLALTKVFFGYVLIALLALSIVLWAWHGSSQFRAAVQVQLIALVLCIPYLTYTFLSTGKVFYWGTSGGLSLYWMSSPLPNELGSWFSYLDVKTRPELAAHHDFFAKLETLSEVERDEALKRQAIYNIAHNPLRFARNWAANVGRLLFSYPFSLASHSLSTFFYIVPNVFVVVLFVLSCPPALLRWRAIPFEIWALLVFALVAFAGSSLLSAYDRQFRPLVPVLGTWMAFVYVRVLRIELRSLGEISGPKSMAAAQG